MTGLNCKKNKLKELYYPFYIKPKKYPSNLTHLKYCDNFNQPIDNLPNSLKKIVFNNGKYNKKLNNLPNSIELIELPEYYKLKIDKIPKKLKKIKCSKDYEFINDFVDIKIENYNY
jgi:hypothetical protein